MKAVRVALLQMLGCGHERAAAQAKGELFCRRARAMGADIALFPELWSTGMKYFDPREEKARAEWQAQAIGRDDPFIAHFRVLAEELRMAIALTYLERWEGAPRNSVFD